MQKDVYQVSADGLVGKVKEILRDAKVKRIVIKDEKGNYYCPFQSHGELQELQ